MDLRCWSTLPVYRLSYQILDTKSKKYMLMTAFLSAFFDGYLRSLHRSFFICVKHLVRYSLRGYSLEGTEKILPPGSPYSSHGSPLRTPMSSSHGSPQDSPHVVRHRRDSEHSSGAISRRGSSDVVSPLLEGHPLGSPDSRSRRRSDYSPHQGRFIHDGKRI